MKHMEILDVLIFMQKEISNAYEEHNKEKMDSLLPSIYTLEAVAEDAEDFVLAECFGEMVNAVHHFGLADFKTRASIDTVRSMIEDVKRNRYS